MTNNMQKTETYKLTADTMNKLPITMRQDVEEELYCIIPVDFVKENGPDFAKYAEENNLAALFDVYGNLIAIIKVDNGEDGPITCIKMKEENAIERINALFEELVPFEGQADNKAGEIIRAVSRIGYRWINDGDMVGVGYGKETCNPAARYLIAEVKDKDITAEVANLWHPFGGRYSDDNYQARIDRICEMIADYIECNPELREESTRNMFEYKDPEEDRDWWDDEDDDEEYEF